jgi:hypothetical protein
LFLRYFISLLEDSHGVEVLLTEEDNIETGLLEVSYLKSEGALREDVERATVDQAHNLYTAN